MRPLIHLTSSIRYKLSYIASHPLRLSSFDLVKVVLFQSLTLYSCPIFADKLLVRDTHSDSCFPRRILSMSVLPVLTLTNFMITLGYSFMVVDWMSVLYLAV